VHELLFWTLVGVALVHAAAAFYHHLFQRDATLARMLPRGWLRLEKPPDPIEDSRNA
jgi:cytochrome b561